MKEALKTFAAGVWWVAVFAAMWIGVGWIADGIDAMLGDWSWVVFFPALAGMVYLIGKWMRE